MKTLLFASLLMFCGSAHGTVFGSGPVRKFYCFSYVSSTGNICLFLNQTFVVNWEGISLGLVT